MTGMGLRTRPSWIVRLLTTLLLLLAPFFAALVVEGYTPQGVIRAQGTRFVDSNCKDVVFGGWNSWDLVAVAAEIPGWTPNVPDRGRLVPNKLDDAVAASLQVGRVYGHGSAKDFVLQTKPGVYNEDVFKGLDKVLDEASKRGIRMVLTMGDSWRPVDSQQIYVNWSREGMPVDDFYSDPRCKEMFQAHMKVMIERRNSINGRKYRDDPTIFAWNLMNEPRCHDCEAQLKSNGQCTKDMQKWIEDMSSHLKQLDPNHMITVGEEGFFSYESDYQFYNPSGPQWQHESNIYKPPSGTSRCGSWNGVWSHYSGQDYLKNHQPGSIDFAAFHMWPDNWVTATPEFAQAWIDIHTRLGTYMDKPVLFEEFGRALKGPTSSTIKEHRNPYFTMAYNMTADSVDQGRALRGAMFWEWDVNEDNKDVGLYLVRTKDSTFQDIVIPWSQKLKATMDQSPKVSNCIPGSSRSYSRLDVTDTNSASESFATAGRSMQMQIDGMQSLGKQPQGSFESAAACAAECMATTGCSAFSYVGSRANGCLLQAAPDVDLDKVSAVWDDDGWQTYVLVRGT